MSSAYSSFFGDTEVQKIDSTASNVTGGTFTLATIATTCSCLAQSRDSTTTTSSAHQRSGQLPRTRRRHLRGWQGLHDCCFLCVHRLKIYVNEPIRTAANADLIDVVIKHAPRPCLLLMT